MIGSLLKPLNGIKSFAKRRRLLAKAICFTAIGLLLVEFIPGLYQTWWNRPANYQLNSQAAEIVGEPVKIFGDKLTYNNEAQAYEYNKDYKPNPGTDSAGQISGPRFGAKFETSGSRAYTVMDQINNVGITFTPEFSLAAPKQDGNRLIYPIRGLDGQKVISLKASIIKEDLIINKFKKNELEFKYKLELQDGLEAKQQTDGSIGIFGVESSLLGNVATGSESDAKLLEEARKNGKKEQLLFTIPAPFVVDAGKKLSEAKAHFELDGNLLAIKAEGLEKAKYPISIDPSVYIETATKLMRGNNETNVDFDITNELIQKSQTTGARIDAWEDNLDMNQGTFDHATAAAGGYVYRVGGRTGPTKPQVVSQQRTLLDSGATFSMGMPSVRPAGDLYIAMMCHDGSDGGVDTAPASWTQIADVQGYMAYYKVGTDQGGGNEAATYDWGGYGSEEWAGVIIRITGFNSSDPVSGTPGTGSNSGSVTPVFPATTPDNDATLVIRGAGFDTDDPSDTGWVPSGHTKLDSESSSNGGANSCGFAATSLDTSPASGVSTGTATFADASVSDDYGASTIAINPVSVTPANQSSVYWAKFNSSTLAIESPTTGDGVCSGWCTDSDYNLPAARRGHSMVAYNGFLYVLGGTDSSCAGTLNACGTVYIAKIGVNGEPSLWHPTDTNPNNWVYWYSSANTLSTDRRYTAAAAYNNRLYLLGGQTDAASGGVTTTEVAEVRPTGDLGSWSTTGMQALPSVRHGHSVQIYNDVMYLIGGNSGGTLQNTVYYSKLNSDGTMNSWVLNSTTFTSARSTLGGSFTTAWAGYIYLAGGCTTVNGSGYCTSIASDVQLASINADGSLTEWGTVNNLQNQRIGYSFLAWQGGLYRLGGCALQNTSTGECLFTLADVDYGVVNPAGEVSTVSISTPSGSGTCTGGSPYNCDIPTVGDGAGQGGQLLTMSAILNGYLYIVGGCTDYDCDGSTPAAQDASGNISYSAIDSQGRLVSPPSCGGTSYGSWCVDNTNEINDTGSTATDGIAAGGITTFNNRIYVVGGLTGNGISTNIYYNSVSASTGALAGAWTAVDLTDAGITEDVAYTFAYTRANPSSAGTYPGNLYLFGGCGNNGGGAGCGSSDYETEVYKCNITTTGSIETADANDCTTSGQLQIDAELEDESDEGLGIHSGTVYANYIYLIGGFSPAVADRDTVFYAEFNSSNNVVSVNTGAAGGNGDDWIEEDSNLSVGRRRGWAFGYNGHIYAVGGYDDSGTGIIPFIEWAKINVSDGSIDEFQTSEITINQRWGLSMVVSNSYAYVIGGCDNGASPGDCDSFEPAVQTFQLYNNDSGAGQTISSQSDDAYDNSTDRIGAASAVYNGYLYTAGGCTNIGCTTLTDNVQFTALSSSNGSQSGSWTSTSDSTLPAQRAWGSLEVAGGTLYYTGGQDSAGDEKSDVYYGTPSSGNVSAWNTASNGLPGDRTQHGSAVWNNRLYVVGGLNDSAAVTNTVYVSPQLSSGGDITSAWSSSTAFNVARSGTAAVAYANNLYLFGGFDGTNYLNDAQFTQINSDGTVDSWSYTTSLPTTLRDSKAVAANGYIYLVGGRSAASTCRPITLVTPISANTTIATGNNPTGAGEWYETNNRYTGDRYGAGVAYASGKIYIMGGGCSSILSSTRHYYVNVKSQPMVAKYSRMIDTDTNVFPTKWLMNGLDNSIGARWTMRYRSSTAAAAAWGQETNFGNVTLGNPENYTPLDSGGSNTSFARYYYFSVSIDASQTFGYPEDVNRGPTLTDLTLFFTADPSKRLRHGKTFTGGELQPLDTPF